MGRVWRQTQDNDFVVFAVLDEVEGYVAFVAVEEEETVFSISGVLVEML